MISLKPEIPLYRHQMIKWVAVFFIAVSTVAYSYIYTDQSILYRSLVFTTAALLALYIVSQTPRGSNLLVILKEARNEMRKVVWPKRQETIQTSLIVVVVVLIMSLLLWGLDSLLSLAISFFIG